MQEPESLSLRRDRQWLRLSNAAIAMTALACGPAATNRDASSGWPDAGETAQDSGTSKVAYSGAAALHGYLAFQPSFAAEVDYADSNPNKVRSLVRAVRLFGPDAGVTCDGGRLTLGARFLDILIDRRGRDAGFVGTFASYGEFSDPIYFVAMVDGGRRAATAQNVSSVLTLTAADVAGLSGNFEATMAALDFSSSGALAGPFSAPYCPALSYANP